MATEKQWRSNKYLQIRLSNDIVVPLPWVKG